MKEIEVPAGDTIHRACTRLAAAAPAFMVFNDTRVEATPGETPEELCRRWVKAREPSSPYDTIDGLVREKNRLAERVDKLEGALRDIRERATWDEDVHDREAIEEDMTNALIAIFDRTEVLFETSEPGGAASKEERNA